MASTGNVALFLSVVIRVAFMFNVNMTAFLLPILRPIQDNSRLDN